MPVITVRDRSEPRPEAVRRAPGHRLVRERASSKNADGKTRHRGRLRHDGARRRPARRRDRRRATSSSWTRSDQSVGLGGLPNEEGVVQLDASVHARSDEARGLGRVRSRTSRRRRRREGDDGLHRPHHARRRGREEVRAADGLQGAESAHRAEPAGLAALEVAAQPERQLARIRAIAAAAADVRRTTPADDSRSTSTTTSTACRTPPARST